MQRPSVLARLSQSMLSSTSMPVTCPYNHGDGLTRRCAGRGWWSGSEARGGRREGLGEARGDGHDVARAETKTTPATKYLVTFSPTTATRKGEQHATSENGVFRAVWSGESRYGTACMASIITRCKISCRHERS